ncbi:MAG TPA: hypothetical protein HPP69_11505 [Deltaproteobacteria bacterium]|nr:hypothetical protein [Deltaproteobacteria bacterium]
MENAALEGAFTTGANFEGATK